MSSHYNKTGKRCIHEKKVWWDEKGFILKIHFYHLLIFLYTICSIDKGNMATDETDNVSVVSEELTGTADNSFDTTAEQETSENRLEHGNQFERLRNIQVNNQTIFRLYLKGPKK